MAQRVRGNPRCMTCGLTPATCLCAELPRLRFSTPIVVVQHNRERDKPTNTGRLFARVVESSTLLRYGVMGETWDPGPLADPSIEWHVLFPRKGGPVLERNRPSVSCRPKGYVLLDGSWPQASRMA